MSRPSCRTRDRDTPSGSCVAIPAGAVDSDTAQPTGQVAEPQVPVALGTITNDVTLPGTINADPAMPVKATARTPVDEVFVAVGQGMVSEFPRFPVETAVLGLAAATFAGALAGLLPALVAVRVKVIDAIRY